MSADPHIGCSDTTPTVAAHTRDETAHGQHPQATLALQRRKSNFPLDILPLVFAKSLQRKARSLSSEMGKN